MRYLKTNLLLAALVIGLAGCGGQQESAAVTEPIEGMVEVDGVELHYLDWGGEGELMLFVPGLGGTAYLWNGIAPHFSDRHRVIALTPREHGASDKPGPPYSIEAFADELAAAIQRFSEGPAIVIGHSFAGATMIELVRRHPSQVAALVFIDALYDFSANPEPPPPLPGTTPPSVFPTVADAEQYFLDFAPSIPRELLEPYIRSRLVEDGTGQFTWALRPSVGERLNELLAAFSIGDLDGVSIPMLAVRVEQAAALENVFRARGLAPDSVAMWRRWAEEWDDVWKSSAIDQLVAGVPGAEAVVVDNVTHSLPIERPDLVVEMLEDFLGSVAPDGS